jgi:hypothetical protein
MIPPMAKRTLIDSLTDMLPAAHIISAKHTEWHSATFSGLRTCIDIMLPGENAAERAEAFRTHLPDQEFNLRRYMVADIAVTGMAECDGGITLSIEALLLDD